MPGRVGIGWPFARSNERENAVDLLGRAGRGRSLGHRSDQRGYGGLECLEPLESAKILFRYELAVQRMHILERQRPSVHLEHEMRRSKELHQRAPCEVRGDRAEDQIDGRRERLRSERKRVDGLVWQCGILKNSAREIQVRQRTLKNEGRPTQLRGAALVERSREFHQFLFAIAAHKSGRFAEVASSGSVRHHEYGRGRERISESDVHNPRKRAVVQPLVVTRLEQGLGGDDVQCFEEWHAREQIEICSPQAARIRRLIGDGHNHVAE